MQQIKPFVGDNKGTVSVVAWDNERGEYTIYNVTL